MGKGIKSALESAGNGSKLATGIFRLIVAPLIVAGIGAVVAFAWSSNAEVSRIGAKLDALTNAMNVFVAAQQGRDMRQDNRMNGLEDRIGYIERGRAVP